MSRFAYGAVQHDGRWAIGRFDHGQPGYTVVTLGTFLDEPAARATARWHNLKLGIGEATAAAIIGSAIDAQRAADRKEHGRG